MARTKNDPLWSAVKRLRVLLPAPDGLPVRIRVTNRLPADTLGDTSKRPTHYLIRLSKEVVFAVPDSARLLLAHEWAHILSWECDVTHGDEWGKELARCWRVLCGEFKQEDIDD